MKDEPKPRKSTHSNRREALIKTGRPKSTSRPRPSSLNPQRSFLSSSLTPKRRFGQNFLIDDGISERIVRELGPRTDETIIEIGPGHGALTSKLLRHAGSVIALELDRDLVKLLSAKFASANNFTLVEADALVFDLCTGVRPATHARVIANLPYYISSAILQRLIEQRSCVSEMVLMLQREVVERITAPPSSSERGFLTVLIEAYCVAEFLFDVPPSAFRPVPKVWASVVRLRVRNPPLIENKDAELFREIVSAGFAQKRKTILNNLKSASRIGPILDKHGGPTRVLERAQIEAKRRAETLTLEEWLKLTTALSNA